MSHTMSIQNVLIEYFSRLKCANFFLLFNKPFSGISSVRVHLRPTDIFINFENDRCVIIKLTSLPFQIQINSLSLLITNDNVISFRTNTASSFHEELLPAVDIEPIGHSPKLRINVTPAESYRIICGNCSAPLSEMINFGRVLELPSENMDLNEWFCHKPHQSDASNQSNIIATNEKCHHHHTSTDDDPAQPQNKFNFDKFMPQKYDLLYGNFFALFHLNHFINVHIDANNKMICCRRCLSHLGECIAGKTAKLWNENFTVVNETSKSTLQQRLFVGDSLFKNFLFIIDRILFDYRMLGHSTQKFLFEAQNFNGNITYLFIQTMTRNLELFQMIDSQEGGEQNNDNENDDVQLNNVITMGRIDGTKCLFRCERNSDQALLRFWQNDVNVVGTQLSIEMLDCVVENLQKYSKFLPEKFRMNNGFCLSYLTY